MYMDRIYVKQQVGAGGGGGGVGVGVGAPWALSWVGLVDASGAAADSQVRHLFLTALLPARPHPAPAPHAEQDERAPAGPGPVARLRGAQPPHTGAAAGHAAGHGAGAGRGAGGCQRWRRVVGLLEQRISRLAATGSALLVGMKALLHSARNEPSAQPPPAPDHRHRHPCRPPLPRAQKERGGELVDKALLRAMTQMLADLGPQGEGASARLACDRTQRCRAPPEGGVLCLPPAQPCMCRTTARLLQAPHHRGQLTAAATAPLLSPPQCTWTTLRPHSWSAPRSTMQQRWVGWGLGAEVGGLRGGYWCWEGGLRSRGTESPAPALQLPGSWRWHCRRRLLTPRPPPLPTAP